ncbi:hypothetical protein SBRY_30632 [Actinacidiphila bryophytorum]|uniref:Uncharacterized protein n=1 Tax=Actinacidiphila bryophytorum TaxID=1436133 RepID=A0A9W4H1D3_9ACTN|nr:hypothetical protein SBRY_30632 [Actinacidiphila bryophytorum]
MDVRRTGVDAQPRPTRPAVKRTPRSGPAHRFVPERGMEAPRVIHVADGSGERDPGRQAGIRGGGRQPHFQFARFDDAPAVAAGE